MRLADKVAIVTGAAGGMGEAAALLFAREGATIAAVDVDGDRLAAVVGAIRADGGQAIAVRADVSSAQDVQHVVDRTRAELGLPTVLFNNAGIDPENKLSILSISEAAFDHCIDVNLKGVWLMIRQVAPAMIEAGGGSIINTASIAAAIVCGTAGYSASKAGVLALTRVAAVELGCHNIRVNAICPGANETPMAKHQRAEMIRQGLPTSNELIDRMGVLGRMAEPEEMARMALFLASDEASFATGATFNNDGGWSAMSGISVQALARQ